MRTLIVVLTITLSIALATANNSPFIFGQHGPRTLQPLSGVLMSVGNTIMGNATTDNLPEGLTNKYLTPGTPNYFSGYDSTGELSSIPGWTFNDASGITFIDLNGDPFTLGSFTFINLEARTQPTDDSTSNINTFSIDSHYDRNNTGKDITGYNALNINHRTEGSGSVQNMYGINLNVQAGNGSGGSVDNLTGLNAAGYVAVGSSLSYYSALNAYLNAQDGTVQNTNMVNSNINGTINGSSNLFSASINNFYSIGFLNGFSFFANPSTTIDGGINLFSGSFGGVSTDNTNGVSLNLSGKMDKSITGYGIYSSATTIANTGYSYVMYNSGLDNVTLGGGNVNVLNGYINGVGDTLSQVYVVNFNNQIEANSFTGINITNNTNQAESIRGFALSSTGDARTLTGVDLFLEGTITDDAQGIRVNMGNVSSVNQANVASIQTNGGIVSFQSIMNPYGGNPVEIGNSFTTTSVVTSGNTLSSSDQFITFIQSNLLVNEDILTGPFGLDTNMFGAISQVSVSSGKNVNKLRSMLLGTSVPSGSGGSIGEHTTLELLGLPSFGGSVSVTTKTMVSDSQLLGQSFCLGATNCYGYRMLDENALNTFAGGVTLSTSTSLPTCDSSRRGTLWNEEGGSGVADVLKICQKDASDNYVWVTL